MFKPTGAHFSSPLNHKVKSTGTKTMAPWEVIYPSLCSRSHTHTTYDKCVMINKPVKESEGNFLPLLFILQDDILQISVSLSAFSGLRCWLLRRCYMSRVVLLSLPSLYLCSLSSSLCLFFRVMSLSSLYILPTL